MFRAWLQHIVPCILILVTAVATASPVVHAQRREEIGPLIRQVEQLYREGKYTRATALAERTLAASERFLGKEHRSTLTSVNNLASLYKAMGRYSEAEALYQRVLEGRERVLGRNARGTLESLDDAAELYLDQGRYDDAERLFKRALEGARAHAGQRACRHP
jgi:tetratricopeptide (TPR) repeat protein